MRKNPFLLIPALLLAILSLGHEWGHYVFRKRYNVYTRGIVIGHPKGKILMKIGNLFFMTATAIKGRRIEYGGAVMPRNAKRDMLKSHQIFMISLAGPLADLTLSAISAFLFYYTNWMIFFVLTITYGGSCVSNMRSNYIVRNGKEEQSDGYKLKQCNKRAWIVSYVLTLIVFIGTLIFNLFTFIHG